jgi:CheY-like chemotaxis protein
LTLSILVFLVEGETLIQELVADSLQEVGFAVVTANDGHEAIAMLEADGAEFRALVSDVHLAHLIHRMAGIRWRAWYNRLESRRDRLSCQVSARRNSPPPSMPVRSALVHSAGPGVVGCSYLSGSDRPDAT